MLRHTFIHFEGIGEATERALWSAGAREWSDLMREDLSLPRIGPARRRQLAGYVARSEEALGRGDADHFARLLPARERWRMFTRFSDRVAYVDIETTGTGAWADTTVVGVYAGGTARVFVRGIDLDEFPGAIEPYDVWVSYNGICFDAPFLVREFGSRVAPRAHIDLMHVLRAVGLKGGLKSVERQVGIRRPDRLQDLDGWDAVRLWREWSSGGEEDSLRTLLSYNLEDIINLEYLLEHAINRHIILRSLPFERVSLPSTPASRSARRDRALAAFGQTSGLW